MGCWSVWSWWRWQRRRHAIGARARRSGWRDAGALVVVSRGRRRRRGGAGRDAGSGRRCHRRRRLREPASVATARASRSRLWTFDDCNTQSSELADSASSTFIRHPAFRSLGVACVAGRDGQAVHLAKGDDVVYAPDQPDFVFDQGLTVAAWINPDRLAGTQSLVRKRLDGTSSFLLALDGKQLLFILKLTNGRVVGTAAPVQAGRFTHVAATYDGTQAVLYLDGVKVASARGAGTIAPGAGPDLPRQRRRRPPLRRYARQRLAEHAGRAGRHHPGDRLRAPPTDRRADARDEPRDARGHAGGVRPGDHQQQRRRSAPAPKPSSSSAASRSASTATFPSASSRSRPARPRIKRSTSPRARSSPPDPTRSRTSSSTTTSRGSKRSPARRWSSRRPRRPWRPAARRRRPSRSRPAATTSTATRCARPTGARTSSTVSIGRRWNGRTSA